MNVAIGGNALKSNTVGDRAISIGYNSLQAQAPSSNTDTYNVAIGLNAMFATTTGTTNVAVGGLSLDSNTTGSSNTAIGTSALSATTTASSNTAVGKASGENMTTGAHNTVVGSSAGDNITTAGFCTLIGSNIDAGNATDSNANGLGYGLSAVGGYTTIGIASSDIRAQNGVATWATVSDRRVKKDIEDSTAGLSFINDLRPRTFNYKNKGDLPEEFNGYEKDSTEPYKFSDTNHGFIAQEIKETIDNHPEIKDGFKMWNVMESGQQEVAEAALIPMLVKSIQELSTQVDELKAKLNKGE